MSRCARFVLLAVCFCAGVLVRAQTIQLPIQPSLVLEGKITGNANKTYIEVPFDVPAGVHRISVDFSYTGRENHTVMDLGIADPERFRGYSGGNKSHFTLSETDATPSYLPGAMPAGRWKLLLSVPNIRAIVEASYRAEIRFNDPVEDRGFALAPLETGVRWYRGDLHMHTAHSDGSCPSQSGKSVPCPLFLTVQTAATRGLDFIAISDHNSVSQYAEMRENQPYFDRLLLIPGREMTTFWGHFNIFGTTEFVDYRVHAHDGGEVNAILRAVRNKGGIASINHPDSPTGEICMGCGWEPPATIDMSLFSGVEVVNGGHAMLGTGGFWNRELAAGMRLTAVGGSDNHNGSASGKPGNVGLPTTVVEAQELSVAAILDGIRRGRVFIDLTGSRDKLIDIEARDSSGSAKMGGALNAPARHAVAFQIHVAGCSGSTVHLFFDGRETDALPALAAAGTDETLSFHWTSDGGHHWLRAEVRDANGVLMLVSNPIYLNFSK